MRGLCRRLVLFCKSDSTGFEADRGNYKVDKPNCRPSEVQEMVFDLMFSLDATEEQLDFPTIMVPPSRAGCPRIGRSRKRISRLCLMPIIKYIPEPKMLEGTPQMFDYFFGLF